MSYNTLRTLSNGLHTVYNVLLAFSAYQGYMLSCYLSAIHIAINLSSDSPARPPTSNVEGLDERLRADKMMCTSKPHLNTVPWG